MLQRFSSRQQKLSSSLLNVNLAGARQYDRIAGYFATSLFDISGESLDQVEGTVRIICNAHLQVHSLTCPTKSGIAAMPPLFFPTRIPPSATSRAGCCYPTHSARRSKKPRCAAICKNAPPTPCCPCCKRTHKSCNYSPPPPHFPTPKPFGAYAAAAAAYASTGGSSAHPISWSIMCASTNSATCHTPTTARHSGRWSTATLRTPQRPSNGSSSMDKHYLYWAKIKHNKGRLKSNLSDGLS